MIVAYRDADAATRNPHPLLEIAEIEDQISALQAKRTALLDLRNAAIRLVALGYTRRQVRVLAGYDLENQE